MRILLLSINLLIIISASGFAQYRNFVELKDSTIIRGKVELSNKMFKKTRLIVNDTTEILMSKVRAYQTTDGYFLRIDQGYGDDFAKRIEKGNVDLYTRLVQNYGGPSYMLGPGGTSTFVGSGFSTSEVEYFSKNGGKLQKASARNLKRALSDNPVSMDFLKRRDNMTVVQVVGVLAGITIGAASIISQSDKDELDPTGAIVGLTIVSGSSWIPYYVKKDLTQKAIKSYNNPRRYK